MEGEIIMDLYVKTKEARVLEKLIDLAIKKDYISIEFEDYELEVL